MPAVTIALPGSLAEVASEPAPQQIPHPAALAAANRRAMLHIGVLQFTLEIPYAETLKDKRNAVKALKDRLRRSFNVSIAEIEDLDLITVATLGAVVAASDPAHLNSTMDHLLNELREWRDGTLADHQLEIITPR